MKMMYGGSPVKSMNIKVFETDTNDATIVPSDLQAGVSAYARGQKVIGTGKSFEFAMYGTVSLNLPIPIPATINVIEVSSTEYPVKSLFAVNHIREVDFSSEKTIASMIVDGEEHAVSLAISNNLMTISCSKGVSVEVFYGKDNYV